MSSKEALWILVLPDKFKGTLTAQEAARAIAAGWGKARPEDSIDLLPICDGGDGFGEVLSELLGAKTRSVRTVDAAHRTCTARWWWAPKTKTAIIESAGVVGLAMLPAGRFHPFELDTYGLGSVFMVAARAGARRCVVGIGGSATNDGGFGLARAWGWQFVARDGTLIERWTDLHRLEHLRRPKHSRRFKELVVAVDVENPLLGRRGASRIYGPQKGLRSKDFAGAERCLRRLAFVVERDLGKDFSSEAGAGAAGGLGFGLKAFLGARLEPGFELFARQADLGRRLRRADVVVTGEGTIDHSTMMGKGVGQIAQCCAKLQIPCIGLAGVLSVPGRGRNFREAYALTEVASIEQARAKAAFWLGRLAARAAERTIPIIPATSSGKRRVRVVHSPHCF